MANYAATKQEIRNYICARTPLVIIESKERERVERMLKELAADLSITMYYYTDSRQVCSINGEHTVDVDRDPLPHIMSVFKKNRSATFAYGDVKRVGDDNSYSREIVNILYVAKEMNCTLILVTADPVWSRIAQFGMLATLDYPCMEERITQVKEFCRAYGSRYAIEWDEEDIRRASTLLGGFTEIQVENILAAALISNNGLAKHHIHELTGQKSRLYPPVSSVQRVKVDDELKVTGLQAMKDWLEEKRKVFFASDEALKERDLVTPKGILLAGVPGCGKSFSAKMVAKEWELPLFRFDLGTIYDKWVGESEKRMKEALQFIDNVSPCVLWIDEVEKALSVSDAGNDTGKRVLGQFLFWLQESTSRVFLVATANDIALLPFELFRKGRFSEVFFIDLPDSAERKAAIRHYAEKSLHVSLGEEELQTLVKASEGFSYSDIEYAVKDIAQLALVGGQAVVSQHRLLENFNAIVPISKSNPEMIEKVRTWGKNRALAASYHLGGDTHE